MILFIRLYKNSKIPVFGPKVWSVVLGFGYFGYFLFLDMKRAVSQNLYGNDGSGKITLKRSVSQNLKSTTIKNRFGKYALSLIHARRENRFYSLKGTPRQFKDLTLKRAMSQNLKSTTINNRFGKYALSKIHARRENRHNTHLKVRPLLLMPLRHSLHSIRVYNGHILI